MTAISGRGVGMDVVRSNVERIGGVVEVDSTPGKGTRMTLRVPLTLTIIPALTVSIGAQHFAIPRSAIEEIVRANGSSVTLERIGGAGVATIRGRRVPEVALADVLGLPSEMKDEDRTLVVLRPAGGDVYALAVDRIHDHEELVVKPAAPAVMATGLYAGTTLADDGSPILLFDPAGVAQVGGVRLEAAERGGRGVDAPVAANSNEVPVLLFRGLDGARRALRLGVVDRIEEVSCDAIKPSAGQLRVQLGEAILPLAGVEKPDELEGKVRVFRLNDGAHEIGYAFREVIDLMSIDRDVIPADVPGAVNGVTLIGGEPAELVDAHWLFAEHLGASARPAGAAGLPPARGRCLDAEHASPDRRGGGLSGDRRDGRTRRRHHDRVAWRGDRGRPGRPRPAPRHRSGCGRRQGQHLSLRPRRPADGPEIRKRGEALMNELLLIVSIAGSRVALPAAAVESVVELEALIAVPRAPDHLAGLSALRSRVLTVIDCQRSLELGTTELNDGNLHEAAVVELDGHHYALTVDAVEDVVEALSEPSPVRAAMGAGWERVSKGMVETEEGPLLLVDIAAIVAGPGSEARAA